MLRAFLLSVLLAVPLLPAASAAPGGDCGKVTDPCVHPVLAFDGERACAGYGTPYGGNAACASAAEVCVIAAGEFWYSKTCYPLAI